MAAQHDRVILPDLLKETSQNAQLDISQQKSFKVVVLNDADHMTKEAQHTLRRTMEKYADNCRLILCCESLSKLIEPLRSRCLAIRVAAPEPAEICDVLQTVASREHIELPAAFAQKIAEASDRNLRRAVLMLEASRVEKYPFKADQAVSQPDWQRFIDDMAKGILEQQNSKRLLEMRNKTYELLQNCIPASVIMKVRHHFLVRGGIVQTYMRGRSAEIVDFFFFSRARLYCNLSVNWCTTTCCSKRLPKPVPFSYGYCNCFI